MTPDEKKLKQKLYYEANKDKIKEREKAYKLANKEVIAQKKKEYREANKDKLKEYRETNRIKMIEYRQTNKDNINQKANDYRKERKKNDNLYKLKLLVRTNIINSLKKNNFNKLSKTEQILGCTFDDLKLHLEFQFNEFMTWENHGLYNGTFNYGWDIDHIIPLSTATNEFELLKLNHYTNLQPLCSKVNRFIKKDNPN